MRSQLQKKRARFKLGPSASGPSLHIHSLGNSVLRATGTITPPTGQRDHRPWAGPGRIRLMVFNRRLGESYMLFCV